MAVSGSLNVQYQYQHERWETSLESSLSTKVKVENKLKRHIVCQINFSKFGQLLLDLRPVNMSLKIMEQIGAPVAPGAPWAPSAPGAPRAPGAPNTLKVRVLGAREPPDHEL